MKKENWSIPNLISQHTSVTLMVIKTNINIPTKFTKDQIPTAHQWDQPRIGITATPTQVSPKMKPT